MNRQWDEWYTSWSICSVGVSSTLIGVVIEAVSNGEFMHVYCGRLILLLLRIRLIRRIIVSVFRRSCCICERRCNETACCCRWTAVLLVVDTVVVHASVACAVVVVVWGRAREWRGEIAVVTGEFAKVFVACAWVTWYS